jgi:hypothetical protein
MNRHRGATSLLLASCLLVVAGGLAPAESTTISSTHSVVDFGAPSPFGFLFGTPIVPIDAPVQATVSITAGLTDSSGDGVAMNLLAPHLHLAEGFLETLLVAVAGAGSGFSVSDADSDPGELTVFSASATVLYAGGLPPYTFVLLDVSFQGSGGDDAYAITASFEVVPASSSVAEPSTLALIAAGALALGAVRPRRARRR